MWCSGWLTIRRWGLRFILGSNLITCFCTYSQQNKIIHFVYSQLRAENKRTFEVCVRTYRQAGGCGYGIQVRNISCLRLDDVIVDNAFCSVAAADNIAVR